MFYCLGKLIFIRQSPCSPAFFILTVEIPKLGNVAYGYVKQPLGNFSVFNTLLDHFYGAVLNFYPLTLRMIDIINVAAFYGSAENFFVIITELKSVCYQKKSFLFLPVSVQICCAFHGIYGNRAYSIQMKTALSYALIIIWVLGIASGLWYNKYHHKT